MKGYKLGTKFNLILLAVFVAGTVITWLLTSWMMGRASEWQVAASAQMLLKATDGVRAYTNQDVKKHLLKVQTQTHSFLPQTVPAFSARVVFENFRKDGYEDFFYKEASTNPTNVKDDKADAFEEGLIQAFRADPGLPTLSGYREDFGGTKRFYTAKALRLKDPSCLECHSTPDAAPAEMVRIYGDKNGFDWQMDDVITTRVVYVPADRVLAQGQRDALLMTGLFVLVFAVAVGLINLLLRRGVIRPLGHLAAAAQAIGQPQGGDAPPQFTLTEAGKALERTARRGDELGKLAERFVAMAGDVRKREAGLRQSQAVAQQREAYFRALIENASVTYVILDSFSLVRYASPLVKKVLGVEAQDLTGKPLLHLVPGDSQRLVLDAVERTEKTRQTSPPVEFQRTMPDGTVRSVEAVATNLLDQPAIKGLVIVLRDVTEKRRREELEQRHRGAENASEAASLFLARVSQELRVPLEDAVAAADALAEEAGRLGNEKLAADSQKIREAARRLVGVVDEVQRHSPGAARAERTGAGNGQASGAPAAVDSVRGGGAKMLPVGQGGEGGPIAVKVERVGLPGEGTDRQLPATSLPATSLPATSLPAHSLAAGPLALADRLVEMLPSMDDVLQQTVVLRLVSAGLVGGKASLPAAGAQAVRAKFQVADSEPLDAGRAVELLILLADFAVSLDTLVWSTWKTLAPKSDLKRSGGGSMSGGPAGLLKGWGHFVAAEGAVPRGQVSYDLERTRALTAALIASVGNAGRQFSQTFLARLAPGEIQKAAQAKGGGLAAALGGKDARCWRTYKELFGELEASKIEDEVLQGLGEYAESLMTSLR